MGIALRERPQTRGEEIANSISHGVGFLLASAALPILVAAGLRRGDTWAVVGGAVFGATLVLLYLASALYHALPRGSAKHVFRVLDHSGIYLLIAGTYTPFTLGALRGGWGWALLGVIWALAILGVVLESVGGVRHPTLSTTMYLAMGWLIVIAAKPLWDHVGLAGVVWLVAGGLAYTAGVAFFAADRIRFGHLIWHLFVLAGSTCHFFAVLHYAS
jgi:hemolysin III